MNEVKWDLLNFAPPFSQYDTLGLGWGNSLLAFIGIALLPIPWILYKFGGRMRAHPRFQMQF
ncbi:uncharacterized protein MYCFIDRAFT_177058 [Pseudocercospora fijiensis CIRAD86]|uniref:Uncharacterized protein n=1 Tax=Pseudocercospora fijiensis (strain CIRAD86) TaxID=383855 RepID=M2YQR9_PSEFD|nr:uncharacterized protein MYCFIDRAFT_177058 [Pseudocercospora fijiensis CIRAD86]EME80075.1 hypothetical protein MYCFIDRAFT_177058 [Pseudocercospora fijiensis CIRAD86]